MNSLELISQAALSLINSEDFEIQIRSVLRNTAQYLNKTRAWLFIDNFFQEESSIMHEYSSETGENRTHCLSRSDLNSLHKMIKEKDELFGCISSELPENIRKKLTAEDVRSIGIYPVCIKSRIKGFIGFAGCREKTDWNNSEIEILKTISGLLSSSFERKIILMELETAKTNLQTFFNTVEDLFIIGNMQGEIVHANNAVIRKLGYSLEELKKMTILQLHPDNKKNEAAGILQAMFAGESSYCPLELETADKSLIPVETRIWTGRWDGAECIFGISKDLSREQEALQKFTKIFENNPALMAISSLPDGIIREVNSAFARKLGYQKNEIIGKRTDELEIFTDPEKKTAITEQLLKSGRIKNIELQVKCKNGKKLNGLFFGEMVENQGKKYFLTIMADITNQAKLTKELKKQKLRYEKIIASTRIGTWEWNIKTGSLKVNERWAEITGYTLEELKPVTIETWKKLAHPDDYKKSNKLLKEHFRGITEFYDFETRMKHKNGSMVWVIDRGQVVEWDSDGEPLIMMGTHTDISSRKRDEILLKETEKRLDLGMKGTGAGLWDWDMINDHVYFSPLWKSMLGYTDTEATGTFNDWKKLWHPDDKPLIEKAIQDYLEGKTGKYEITHRLRHKNGQWSWILTRGELLRDKNGKPYRWVGTNIDITADKERSNELERFFSVNLDLLCIADKDGNFIKVNIGVQNKDY